jgi:hypothetical protein
MDVRLAKEEGGAEDIVEIWCSTESGGGATSQNYKHYPR